MAINTEINTEINKEEHAFWLALNRTKGLGSVRQKKLIQACSSVREIFSTDPQQLRELGLREQSVASICQPDWRKVEADLAWLENPDCYLVTLSDPQYPSLLREISDPPVILFVRGCLEVLQQVQIAMVGSRNPDRAGHQIAEEFAASLVVAGATITSGLALGIDGASHQGALDAGGCTIAVAGNGLDMVYPARHKPLAERIVESGALISEFPPGDKPIGSNFPRRNRIISGMSTGVLVVQATLHSGSLITAYCAMEQGREVFAVPGSIYSPLVKGCHVLIKQGAKLVESANEVVEELSALTELVVVEQDHKGHNQVENVIDTEYKLLLDNMSYDPISADRLVELTGLTIDTVSSMLLRLELRGMVISLAGGMYTQVTKSS